MKILIVDDQPMMLKTLEIKFGKEGYEVITTNNAEEAMLIIASQPIDVVLTEVNFPNVPDFEILKAAKKKDYNIVVIIVSIHSLEQTIVQAFESGAEEYLVKPVNLNLLSVRIRKLLKVKKMREVLARSIPASERQNLLRQLAALDPMETLKKPLVETEETSPYAPALQTPTARSILMGRPIPEKNLQLPKQKNKYTPKDISDREVEEEEEEEKTESFIWNYRHFQRKLFVSLKDFLPLFIVFVGCFLFTRIFELIADSIMHGTAKLFGKVILFGTIKDLLFCLHTGLFLFVSYFLFSFINKKLARLSFISFSILILLIQIGLSQYFLTSLVPLGGDFFNYSWADIKQTVNASGALKISTTICFIIAIALIIFAFIFFPKKVKPSYNLTISAGIIILISLLFSSTTINKSLMPGKEYSNSLSINKSWFFYNASWQHFFPSNDRTLYTEIIPTTSKIVVDKNSDSNPSFNYTDPTNYPFLHLIDTTRDVLSPFFDSSKTSPNIVIILVEGLGRAFSNKNAYLGNFTPFLDSLSDHSLYWQNFLSEGGRTFAVLPSVLGSLPFNKTGFIALADSMPSHVSLLSILKKNGYNTSFYYGGDSHFDNMDTYMKKNEVSNIYDQATFPSAYTKMPGIGGFSWGFSDKDLFKHYFETKQNIQQPIASVLLTVSTHDPFIIKEQSEYQLKFEARMNDLKLDEYKKSENRNYKAQYTTIMYMDDAIREFINTYKQRPDFTNTIFIITGDHRMPEIPMSTKIDRYHVPLIIYSPLLKKTATISSISTHFDITPSLTMLLHKMYGLNIPLSAQWIGSGLDTSVAFRNIHNYPFKQVQTPDSPDFLSSEYFLNEGLIFKLSNSMDLELEQNPTQKDLINSFLNEFKKKNDAFIKTNKLIPDTLAQKWGSK